jgi:hypothetical protein
MKTIYLFLFLSISSTSLFSQVSCTETLQFNWKNAAGVGFDWPITNGQPSVMRTYTKTGVHGTATVRAVLENLDGQNIDFSNCGTNGNHFYTATHNDPNAATDCGPGVDGQFSYGPDYLTMGMTSRNSNDKISITFIFNYPSRISDFDIWDIDYQGGNGKGSWEDEMDISAKFVNMPVAVRATSVGSAVIVTGNNTTAMNIRSLYGPGNGNLSPTDAAGSVFLSTDVLVTSFTITYSNGPNDDGESDDHAIKIGSFSFCPNFSHAPLPVSLTSFGGFKQLSGAAMYWSAANESSLQIYELQYSTNGSSFETITSITPKGIAGGVNNYNYTHKDIFTGSKTGAHYRLKMIDADGTIGYSKTVYIVNNTPDEQPKIYPNPIATGEDMIIQQKNIRDITITNAAGFVLFTRKYSNTGTVIIPGNVLHTKGILFVRVNGGAAQKIIVQ